MKWQPDEVHFLLQNYANIGPNNCAKILGRTLTSVTNKANSLTLKSPYAVVKEELNIIKKWAENDCCLNCGRQLAKTTFCNNKCGGYAYKIT